MVVHSVDFVVKVLIQVYSVAFAMTEVYSVDIAALIVIQVREDGKEAKYSYDSMRIHQVDEQVLNHSLVFLNYSRMLEGDCIVRCEMMEEVGEYSMCLMM